MNEYISYSVSFSSEMPHLIVPEGWMISGEGPLHRSIFTIYEDNEERAEKMARTFEHILQNQSNVRGFRRLVRILETDVPESFSERYSNKRDAVTRAREVGADVIVNEAANRRGNVYFLVPWAN